MDVRTVRGFSLFATLSDQDLEALLGELHEQVLAPGEVLMSEGGRTEQIYLLVDGEVEVVKALGPNEERLLAVRGKGTMLGEMSIFNDNRTHTATVRARTPLRLLVMTFLQFDRMIHQHPEIAYGMLRVVSRRLQETDELVVADLREKNRQLTRAYEELQAAQAGLIEKEKIEHELQLAGNIQRSILPHRMPVHPQFDFGALMIPARLVGGDFYDVIPISEHELGIVVGDVCDKGMPAALYMALTYSALRIEASKNHSPGETLRAVNRHLKQVGLPNMYVTLVYGVLDTLTGSFRYARAGHPYPLLLDCHHRPILTAQASGQPLGMFRQVMLDEQVVLLPPGGTMLIYSDGLSETLEARETPQELDTLCRAMLEGQEVSAQELCDRLWRTAGDGLAGHPPISDDFTVIAVRRQSVDAGRP